MSCDARYSGMIVLFLVRLHYYLVHALTLAVRTTVMFNSLFSFLSFMIIILSALFLREHKGVHACIVTVFCVKVYMGILQI